MSARVLTISLVVVTISVAGCGERRKSPEAVRIGASAITAPQVNHWVSVLLHEGIGGGKRAGREPVRKQAVALLIQARWLVGEAKDRGAPVSQNEVDQALAQEESTYPSRSEFAAYLRAVGKTVADVRLEAEARLAATRLRDMLTKQERPVTSADVAAYYRQHLASYAVPETRQFDIVNNLTLAQAAKLKREVEHGKDFSSHSLHEFLERPPGGIDAHTVKPEKVAITRAIFATPVGPISGPEPLLHAHSIFKVTHILRATHRPLDVVKGEIDERLKAREHRRALAAFVDSVVRRWKARTQCERAYVASGCAQYTGAAPAEDLLVIAQ
jgi:parvulin-like peptidyl-prolyl cis-trans isomerase-like protein